MHERKRILVVDDDIDCLDQVRMMLAPLGHEVVTARGQAEGEDAIMRDRPDLAIVDLMMENMDSGFVLCHEIKKVWPGTPVMILTAVSSATGMDFSAAGGEALAWMGADAFIDKPVRKEKLQNEVRKLLSPRREVYR